MAVTVRRRSKPVIRCQLMTIERRKSVEKCHLSFLRNVSAVKSPSGMKLVTVMEIFVESCDSRTNEHRDGNENVESFEKIDESAESFSRRKRFVRIGRNRANESSNVEQLCATIRVSNDNELSIIVSSGTTYLELKIERMDFPNIRIRSFVQPEHRPDSIEISNLRKHWPSTEWFYAPDDRNKYFQRTEHLKIFFFSPTTMHARTAEPSQLLILFAREITFLEMISLVGNPR